MELLFELFSGKGFMPHGHCYLWTPALLWLNVVSDTFITLAYLSIPVTLIYFIRKRQDLPFNWMFLAFGVFILACGATHALEIWTTWYPAYWLSGAMKAVTALASIVTAYLLIKLLPAALAIPSHSQLANLNNELLASNEKLHQTNQRLEDTHEQLLQQEKMAALGRLVAGVAHEINTPLGIIVTGSSLLSEETQTLHKTYKGEGLSQQELEQFLHTTSETILLIQLNAKRAADLVQSFKQVAVDRAVSEKRKIRLIDYIKEVFTSLAPTVKKTAVSTEIRGNEELEAEINPGTLSQILTNLVMNSVIHGFEGKADGRILVEVDEDSEHIRLTYYDNGKGIPKEWRTRVFEPFFTSKRHAGGSGLGLHILHNLVTSTLAGKVRIDDAVAPWNTLFVIEFPKFSETNA